MKQRTRFLTLLTLAFAAEQSECFAGIHVEAGSFQVDPCRYRTLANITVNGNEARRLYQTLEDIPETEEHGRRVKWAPQIECSVYRDRGDYLCHFRVNTSGEMQGPQRQVSQRQQQQQAQQHVEMSQQQQQPQQRQCPLQAILFE